jgi:hypothetical protein
MRPIYILLAISMVGSSGCSFMIAGAGTDLRSITTREEVHKQFGTPLTSEVIDGQSVETFHTRQKICEPIWASGMEMAVGMSIGLAEIVCGPVEFVRLVQRTVLGQELNVIYDATGKVKRWELEPFSIDYPRQKDSAANEKTDPAAAKKADMP